MEEGKRLKKQGPSGFMNIVSSGEQLNLQSTFCDCYMNVQALRLEDL